MSVYASLYGPEPTLYTTDYTPRPLTADDQPCGSGLIDVAVAHSFHNKVRLIVEPSSVCMDSEGARLLALRLIEAATLVDHLDANGVDKR